MRGVVVTSALVSSMLMACGGDGPAARNDALDGGAPPDDGAVDATVADLDSTVSDASADAIVDAAPAYVPPTVSYPTSAPSSPFLLSSLGLYVDIASKTLAPDLIAYEPKFTLWSDGALKDRHLRLPAGTRIDGSDMDHWQLPVGAVLFKEFRTPDKRLETRVVARIGTGDRDYFFGAFVWRDDESDAELAWEGAMNVRGTEHDVPTVKQCGTCHNGEPGRALGVSAVQTPSLAMTLLEVPPAAPFAVPGDPVTVAALGYLQANCAHCHNPNGSARPDTDLNLKLLVGQLSVMETNSYQSTVGKELQSFMSDDFKLRIAPGMPEQSGLLYRMSQRGPKSQMPPIATEQVDDAGIGAVRAYIAALGP